MAEESDLERTEPASSRRLEQAREEGQVPHSRELSAFLVMMTAAGVMWFMGGWFFQRLALITRRGLSLDGTLAQHPGMIGQRFAELSVDAMLTLAPLLVALLVAALISPLLLNAWVFAPKALMPNLSRMNPLQGLGRIVSWQGLVELAKGIAKALLVGGVAVWVLWRDLDGLLALLGQPLEAGLVDAGQMILFSFVVTVAAMALIVAIDVPFQLWQYHDKLKMTKQEVRQEGKEMEGNPEVKGRIRTLQRDAARRRMMAAVPGADVIVTNPTHFAVALAYTAGMRAPKVLAKGRGELAMKIREIGAGKGVPLLEAPPLARALYRWAEVGDEIPNRLYAAVAEVLAYVYQLDRYRQTGGNLPLPPRDLPVPSELDPGMSHG